MTASAPTQDRAPATSTAATPRRGGSSRLAWLDALRGIAALAVVYTHLAFDGISEVYHATSAWVIAGTFGVLTFFVISGYIVPASLERKGSIRAFWVSRFFRLYPLWLLALAAVAVLVKAGERARPEFHAQWESLLAAHLTMLQQLIRLPNVINVMWTLSYEMAFYFMVVALFAVGAHRISAEISVGFTTASLVGGGGLIPTLFLLKQFGWKVMLLGVVLVFVVGLALSVTGKRVLAIAGAVLLGVTGFGLLALNEAIPPWFGLLLPATMFAGTAIYRAEHGQIARWKAIAAIGVLLLGGGASAMLHNPPPDATFAEALRLNRPTLITMALVAVAFAIGMALRHRKIPRVLTWLGLISYSTYLLHPLIHHATPWYERTLPFGQRLGVFALWVVLLLLVSWATYRLIEKPSQDLGRKAIRALDARFGPDRSAIGHRDDTSPVPPVTATEPSVTAAEPPVTAEARS